MSTTGMSEVDITGGDFILRVAIFFQILFSPFFSVSNSAKKKEKNFERISDFKTHTTFLNFL